jgi:hypothetical protein
MKLEEVKWNVLESTSFTIIIATTERMQRWHRILWFMPSIKYINSSKIFTEKSNVKKNNSNNK